MAPTSTMLRLVIAAIALGAATGANLRILLLTGGCWHNYAAQEASLRAAFARAGVAVTWTVASLPCKGPSDELPLLQRAGWAGAHDVVLFNGCFGAKRPAYVRGVVRELGRGKGLVAVHCAMHSFRSAPPAAAEAWRELLGVTSRQHEKQGRYAVRVVAPGSQIMRGIAQAAPFTMPIDELYIVDKVWPGTRVLALSKSDEDGRDHPVFWSSVYRGRTRVFGTTFGHSDQSLADPIFGATIVRGALWAARKPLVQNCFTSSE